MVGVGWVATCWFACVVGLLFILGVRRDLFGLFAVCLLGWLGWMI